MSEQPAFHPSITLVAWLPADAQRLTDAQFNAICGGDPEGVKRSLLRAGRAVASTQSHPTAEINPSEEVA